MLSFIILDYNFKIKIMYNKIHYFAHTVMFIQKIIPKSWLGTSTPILHRYELIIIKNRGTHNILNIKQYSCGPAYWCSNHSVEEHQSVKSTKTNINMFNFIVYRWIIRTVTQTDEIVLCGTGKLKFSFIRIITKTIRDALIWICKCWRKKTSVDTNHKT